MKKLIPFCCAFLLVACNTEEKLKIVLDSYKGYNQSYVMQNFGQPKRIYDNGGGTKVIEYLYTVENFDITPNNVTKSTYVNSNNGTNSKNVSFGYGSMSGTYSSSECKLSFTTDSSNLVRDWHYSGSLCTNYASKQNLNHQYVADLARTTDRDYGFKLDDNSKGMKVKEIYAQSSAYQLGLRQGDLITKINDLDLAGEPVALAYHELNSKEQAKIYVSRKAEEFNLVVKKSNIPRSYSFKKSTRKFLGLNN